MTDPNIEASLAALVDCIKRGVKPWPSDLARIVAHVASEPSRLRAAVEAERARCVEVCNRMAANVPMGSDIASDCATAIEAMGAALDAVLP